MDIGDNLEDRLGHVRYFFFYLLCGVIASLTHVFLIIYLMRITWFQALALRVLYQV